jgi:uncharacterized membrane protein
MRLIQAGLLTILAALAACSDPAPPAEPPAPAPTAAVLGGVDLSQPVRAIGAEPFWSVEITPETLAYSAVDSAGLRAANPGPTIQGTTAVYAAAASDGTALVVTLIATECSDGMSDRTYPLTARVEVGQQTLNGCAASVAFLGSAPQP